MVLETIAAAAAGLFATQQGTHWVWHYNRKLYKNDRAVALSARYQRLQMRKEWVMLARSDIVGMQQFTVDKLKL